MCKSKIMAKEAKKRGLKVHKLKLRKVNKPSDYVGFPRLVPVYKAWEKNPQPQLLLMDELPRMGKREMKSLYKTIMARRAEILSYKLPKGWRSK